MRGTGVCVGRPVRAAASRDRGAETPPWLGVRLGGALLLGVLVCGCGGKSAPKGARLEGAVTLDGQPIAVGRVQFVPQGPGKGGPVSAEIKDGRYAASQVPLGKLRVTFAASKKTGKMIKEYSQPYEEVVSIIPAKYEQGIEITVTGDNPNQDFALRSR